MEVWLNNVKEIRKVFHTPKSLKFEQLKISHHLQLQTNIFQYILEITQNKNIIKKDYPCSIQDELTHQA